MTIEYDNIKFEVPEGWQDVTLATYEAVYKIKPEEPREGIPVIEKICGVPAGTFLRWPVEIFNIVVDKILFIYGDNPYTAAPDCTIDGTRYIAAIEEKLTLGEWIDADAAQNGEAAISNTLAIVCRPVGEAYNPDNNEARQQLFATQTMDKILPVLGFFLRCKLISVQHTSNLLTLQETANLLPRNIRTLLSLGTGIKWLRIYQVIRFYILMLLLRARLQKYLRTYSTSGKKIMLKMRKGNLINS